MLTGMSNRRRPSSEDIALGAVVGGLAGFVLGAAIASSAKTPEPKPRFVVGGVDLTDTNLSLPFYVDFSVGPRATAVKKRTALGRLRGALSAFAKRFPTWVCQPDVDVAAGRFLLNVYPYEDVRRAVAHAMAKTRS